MTGRIIESEACVAEGAAWLAARDPHLAAAMALCGPLPLRRRGEGYAALAWAITGQQVSTASAAAIWARVAAAGLDDPGAVSRASDAELAAAGLSRPKQRYLRALAAARIDYAALRVRPDAEVIATLTGVPGVGRWTAEIYAMTSLGRADVFAAGDLALQEAARRLYGLDARPNERELRAMATRWSPWGSVAARTLWAYYRSETGREGTR